MNKIILLFATLINCFSVQGQVEETPAQKELGDLLEKGFQFLYTNNDSITYFFDKAYKIAERENDLESKLTILAYLVFSNGYHYNPSQIAYNLMKTDSILKNDPLFNTLPSKDSYEKRLYFDKANYYYKINNYTLCLNNLTALKTLINQVPDSLYTQDDKEMLYSSNNYMASVFYHQGKNELAKQLYQENLKNQEEKKVAKIQMLSSLIYSDEGNYKKSNELLSQSLSYYLENQNDKINKNSILSNYQKLTENYIKEKKYDSAVTKLRESAQFYIKGDAFNRNAMKLYGDIFLEQMNFLMAEEHYKSYLEQSKVYRDNQKHEDIAEVYSRFGKLYSAQNKFDKSLAYYQLALIQLENDFDDVAITSHPKPEAAFSKLVLIKTLKQKLEVLQQAFMKSDDIKYLQIAEQTSQSFVNALDLLKPEFESKVDKQFLISEMYPAFDMMVSMSYELYIKTKKDQYIQNAFHFMEKSKSMLLLESVRNAQATVYGGVKESLVAKEQQYRAKIIHLEKLLFNKQVTETVSDSLGVLKSEYYQFVKDMEQKYPHYYDLKYKNEVINIAKLQAKIDKDRAVVSYYATVDNLYSITITKKKIKFHRVNFDKPFRDDIISFYKQLSNPKLDQIKELNVLGWHLYQRILKQPIESMDANTITIIADDVLNYIPFDVLSLSAESNDYLVRKYQVSYANSATLMSEASNTVKKKGKLIAFAPKFEGVLKTVPAIAERGDFGPLLYNIEEVKSIVTYFNGSAFLGKEASISSLSKHIKDCTIIHFATHAVANDQNPDYSYLAFASDNKALDLLYVKDLYGYTINADMVTLSACQTGIGKLQKGEGMLSLARGFSYAGAKSLVMTLWKINDQTTAELMSHFYSGLNKGKSKDEALHNAKLEYLNTVDDAFLKHPYYWSGFIISGDMTPLASSPFNFWWLLLSGIPILLICIRKWIRN